MEWADETIIRLRELWSEGHSTAEIGRRLGVSKNAVVGKAHRLDLPARPSPIRREGERPPPRSSSPRRIAGPTLPPLSSASLGGTSLSSGGALGGAGGTIAAAVVLPPRPPAPMASRPALQPARVALTAPPPRPVRPCHHLLLADRRAGHAQLPLLRRRVGARQAVLRRACAVGLCEGEGPPRGRRLTLHPPPKTRMARGTAAIRSWCEAGRSGRMKP